MSDRKFWNDRYRTAQFIYGTEANTFLVKKSICCKILCFRWLKGKAIQAWHLSFSTLPEMKPDSAPLRIN